MERPKALSRELRNSKAQVLRWCQQFRLGGNGWSANRPTPLLMYGMLLACFGFTMYIFGVLLAVPRNLLNGGKGFLAFNEWVVWYSGVPVVLGLSLALVDLFLLLGHKRSPRLEV